MTNVTSAGELKRAGLSSRPLRLSFATFAVRGFELTQVTFKLLYRKGRKGKIAKVAKKPPQSAGIARPLTMIRMPAWLTQLNREVVACTRCPRLVEYRQKIAREKRRAYVDWEYWGRPVPGFGDPNARVLVLGLAPGAHGSNRTGRPFTGDASGKFMYPILYEAGFSNQPDATKRDDGLELRDLYITAAVRCAPPDNKPLPQELANCAPFLDREMEGLEERQSGGCPGQNWLRGLP